MSEIAGSEPHLRFIFTNRLPPTRTGLATPVVTEPAGHLHAGQATASTVIPSYLSAALSLSFCLTELEMQHSQLSPLPSDLPFRVVSKTIGRGAYAS